MFRTEDWILWSLAIGIILICTLCCCVIICCCTRSSPAQMITAALRYGRQSMYIDPSSSDISNRRSIGVSRSQSTIVRLGGGGGQRQSHCPGEIRRKDTGVVRPQRNMAVTITDDPKDGNKTNTDKDRPTSTRISRCSLTLEIIREYEDKEVKHGLGSHPQV